MPDKKKKVKVIYVVEKRKKRKKNKKKQKTQQTFNKIPLTNEQLNSVPRMFASNTPANLFSQAQSTYFPTIPQIVTPPRTDWEDLVKKLIESQSKAVQTAITGTPTPKATAGSPGFSSSSSSSSSSYQTPYHTLRRSTIKQPVTTYEDDESDLETAAEQQMPPSFEDLAQQAQDQQAAKAASSLSKDTSLADASALARRMSSSSSPSNVSNVQADIQQQQIQNNLEQLQGNPGDEKREEKPIKPKGKFISAKVSGKPLYDTAETFQAGPRKIRVFLSSSGAAYLEKAGQYEAITQNIDARFRPFLKAFVKTLKYPQ